MKIAVLYFLIGFVFGILYDFIKMIIKTFKNNVAIQIICEFAFTISFGACFIVLNNFFFYGDFRLYLLIFILLGLWSERKTLGKLFAKLYLLLYNKVSKLIKFFKLTRLGKILFR